MTMRDRSLRRPGDAARRRERRLAERSSHSEGRPRGGSGIDEPDWSFLEQIERAKGHAESWVEHVREHGVTARAFLEPLPDLPTISALVERARALIDEEPEVGENLALLAMVLAATAPRASRLLEDLPAEALLVLAIAQRRRGDLLQAALLHERIRELLPHGAADPLFAGDLLEQEAELLVACGSFDEAFRVASQALEIYSDPCLTDESRIALQRKMTAWAAKAASSPARD